MHDCSLRLVWLTICCLCITLRASNFENKDYDALNEQSVRGESSFTAEDNAEIVTQLQQDGGAGGSWSQAAFTVQEALRILQPLQPPRSRLTGFDKSSGILGTTLYYAKEAFVLLFMNGPPKDDYLNPRPNVPKLSKPLAQAVTLLESAAEEKEPDAIFLLAEMNFFGNYTHPRNYTEAFRRYHELALLNGNSSAQHMVGFMYATGLGGSVERDQAKALMYHTFAAKGDNTRAQMTIGYRHHTGLGTPRNCNEAAHWYKQVADKAIAFSRSGPPGGQVLQEDAYKIADELGGVYGEGASVVSSGVSANRAGPNSDAHADFDDVLEYLDLMSRKGELKATFSLGQLHYKGSRTMRRNLKIARAYFMTVARKYWQKDGSIREEDQGIAKIASKAAGYIGRMFLRGEGMEQSYEKALTWFRRGVVNGDALCQYELGLMHLHGLGVRKDPLLAGDYFKESANQDFASAQVNIGQLFLDQGDITTATRFFDLAARHGHIEAFYHLAEISNNGVGRERSCGMATAYYKIVAEKVESIHSSFDEANRAYDDGDTEAALVMYMMAAEQGYEYAQANVAYLLDEYKSILSLDSLIPWKKRRSSLLRNAVLALIYWTRSAKQSNIDSMVKMGDYYLGGYGIEADIEKAATCYQTAAETHQSAQALWNLGWIHENGIGVEQDFHLAKRFYDQALETNQESYLPVKLSLTKLRMRSFWNTITNGKVNSIQSEPEPKKDWSFSEWLSTFLEDPHPYYHGAEDDDIDYDDPSLPGSDDSYYDELDESILESLIIVGIAAAIAFLVYYRQQRQTNHRRDLERRQQEGGDGGAVQGNAGGIPIEQRLPGQQADGGFFPPVDDPNFGQWVAGGPLRLLYEPDYKAGEVARVDIIAVHGLNPRSVPEADHAWDTWRKPPGDKGRLWLQEDLPKYAPYARIFLYQYNSKLVYGGDKTRFIDKANDLLEASRIERKKDEKRPLIFLAHSLGGILVRQALVNAHNNPKYNMIHTSTTGLAFFGTPHEGGDERLVALGAAAARIASALQAQPSNDLIETLKKGSLFSDVLAEHWRHHLESYQLVSFWEGIGDIVPKKSATFGLSGSRENVVRLEASHSDLCRFDEHDEDNSKLVLNNIEDLYEQAISKLYDLDVRETLEWVSRIPYEQHHNTNKSDVLQGTGSWLFEEEIFIKWKQDGRSTILWLHGIPGCGKTKLVSLVVEKQRAALDKRQGLAFFYCNRNDSERERANPEDILRSIVRQLSMSGPQARLSEFVAAKYTERQRKHFADGPLRLDECVNLINKLTEQYTSTTIVIDALDECDVTTRHNLLAALSSIMQHGSPTKIFVSSRDDKDITLKLQELPNLYIKASNNAKDIDRYVHFKVEQAVADRRLLDGNVSSETVYQISRTLTDKAQGMFLWVTLQLQNLCSLRLNVEEDLVNELGKLPEDLADTYTQIFEHVGRLAHQSRVIAERSLKWLLCQAREFSEREFLAAVSIGTEGESFNVTKETILFICGNLVVFDRELQVFRFAHLSVREYLETRPNFTLGAAHALGAEISLLICVQRYTDLAAKYARIFRRYAIMYWLYHCQEAKKSGLSDCLYRLLEDFLHIREGTNLCYAYWARCLHRLMRASNHSSYTWPRDSWNAEANDGASYNSSVESGDGSIDGTDDWIDQNKDILDSILGDPDHPYDPTFTACFLDLPEIVEQNLSLVLYSPAKQVPDLVSDTTEVFERRNMYGETYLHVACNIGSSKLLRLLLQYPIPVRARDLQRRTALHCAVLPHHLISFQSARWTETVRDAHDPTNAAERVAMLSLLIKRGSIIDAAAIGGETALHRAINANLCTHARCLLEYGAFVDAKTNVKKTPLHLAVELGHTTVARVLLQFKANIEARDFYGRTPLLQAAESRHTAFVLLLLQFKANIEARDCYGRTPLLQAAESRHTAFVQLLLQFKADIEARDSDGKTPLLLAAKSGHTAITELLLRSKADIEARDSDGKTPLLQAAESGHTAITELLLRSKADIEARDSGQGTPLLLAAVLGHTAIVQLLLQSKAHIEARDGCGRTPLIQTARRGNIDTGRLLLRLGADINAKDSRDVTSLSRSLLMRQEAMAQMLIDESASIRELDMSGNTVLHYAAGSRLGATISRLLEMGAYTNNANVHGATPLHVAIYPHSTFPKIRYGNDDAFPVVQLLVDAGADVEISNHRGRTPLHLAARTADEASTQILLNRGANVKAKDSMGLLPLDHAATSGSLPVFSLLYMRWSNVKAESSKFAVEAWLRLAARPRNRLKGVTREILRAWRRISIEDLVELTTSGSEILEIWDERDRGCFHLFIMVRLIQMVL